MATGDRQAGKLYNWESEWATWNVATVPLVECRKFVRQACSTYGAPPPTVSQHRHTEMSYYDPDPNKISFRLDHKNVPIALHEAAHAIIWHYYGASVQDHGPEFVGVYFYLLRAAKTAPVVAIEASARAAGIKWKRGMSPQFLKEKGAVA